VFNSTAKEKKEGEGGGEEEGEEEEEEEEEEEARVPMMRELLRRWLLLFPTKRSLRNLRGWGWSLGGTRCDGR
jgi:hypothetical protein